MQSSLMVSCLTCTTGSVQSNIIPVSLGKRQPLTHFTSAWMSVSSMHEKTGMMMPFISDFRSY